MDTDDKERTEELVTIPKAARRSGLGLRQLRRAISTGELVVHDFGWPRLKWRDVASWIESRRRTPGG